ncbi:hypothetical protein BDQ17DRAFT_1327310 [Cyathus striatus]|nr:hypothetical protein BDQ17DRAFT_1327310 [Cyathus striatus]
MDVWCLLSDKGWEKAKGAADSVSEQTTERYMVLASLFPPLPPAVPQTPKLQSLIGEGARIDQSAVWMRGGRERREDRLDKEAGCCKRSGCAVTSLSHAIVVLGASAAYHLFLCFSYSPYPPNANKYEPQIQYIHFINDSAGAPSHKARVICGWEPTVILCDQWGEYGSTLKGWGGGSARRLRGSCVDWYMGESAFFSAIAVLGAYVQAFSGSSVLHMAMTWYRHVPTCLDLTPPVVVDTASVGFVERWCLGEENAAVVDVEILLGLSTWLSHFVSYHTLFLVLLLPKVADTFRLAMVISSSSKTSSWLLNWMDNCAG